MTYKVYAGYYELFISTSTLSRPFVFMGEFSTVAECESFCEKLDEYAHILYERAISCESWFWYILPEDDENAHEKCVFDVTEEGLVLQGTDYYKKQHQTLQ